MPVMGPDLSYERERGEKFANALIDEHLRIEKSLNEKFPDGEAEKFPCFTLALRVHQQLFPNHNSWMVATWVGAFAIARPEGSLETFRAYLIEMFVMEGCWSF